MEDLGTAMIRAGGMEFSCKFGYPHAFLAARPSGRIFIAWDELEGFLLPGVSR